MSIFVTKDNSAEVIAELKRKARFGLEQVGMAGEGYAKMKCPVDTGNLRNSISHAVSDMDVYIGTNVEYAPYVELGTSRQHPQPYLRPAAADHYAEYTRIFENALK